MTEVKKYDFSFTGASLRLPEMIKVAESIYGKKKLNITEDIGRGKTRTGEIIYGEMKKRLNTLTQRQIELFLEGDLTRRKQIAFLAICKCFAFIRDFTVEVMRNKTLVFDYEITDGDYLSFYRQKNELHLEMDSLTEQSEKKIRQVLFKILEQTGMIDNIKNRNIRPQFLERSLEHAVVEDNPEWLQIFLVSNLDIENAVN